MGQKQSRLDASKVHWSEIPGDVPRQDGAERDMASFEIRHRNERCWKALQKRDPLFFQDCSKHLKIGRKIAEGGQAEIFAVSWKHDSEFSARRWQIKLVLKVFKLEGCSLEDLIRQWPCISSTTSTSRLLDDETNDERVEQVPEFLVSKTNVVNSVCEICAAYLLKDGRFVFVMPRYDYDLRSYIDKQMQRNKGRGPPFSNHHDVLRVLSFIARGMQWLHNKDVLHRDLKAANVMVMSSLLGDRDRYWLQAHKERGIIFCSVADFECSNSTLGTGFWRAPEVLQEMQKESGQFNVTMWTKKSDVYSFAMTCFEVLTGDIPLSECSKKDWVDVIHHGKRPELPDYVDSKLQQLVKKCWDKDPLERPSFDDIVDELSDLYNACRVSGN